MPELRDFFGIQSASIYLHNKISLIHKEVNMKGKRLFLLAASLVAVLVVSASPALAAGKPADVIEKSNGFPSGMHFNLNIHGMDLSLDDPCTHEPGGNSVFIDLYGTSTIEYQSNKRSSVTELVVTDPCASGDGKVAVQIPTKVTVVDETTLESQDVPVAGYYVYGRILAKPQNGKNDPQDRSNILFSPNVVTDAYNLDEEMVALGLITWNATYYAGEDAFYRFDEPASTGKGKSAAKDITHLFQYTGWVVDASLDTNSSLDDGISDNVINIWDVPLGNYDILTDPDGTLTPENRDFNNDGIENDDDVAAWLATQGSLATSYTDEWIFNIADVVTTEGQVTNDGTKLFQVRFYPYFG
jgi:hypothetical protein